MAVVISGSSRREISLSDSNSIKNVTHTTKFTWEIPNFSRLNVRQGHQSEVFFVGSYRWKLGAYGDKDNNKLSVYLFRPDTNHSTNMPYVEYKFVISSPADERNDVIHVSNNQSSRRGIHGRFGCESLMPLLTLFDPANGYLIDNKCIIKVEVSCRA